MTDETTLKKVTRNGNGRRSSTSRLDHVRNITIRKSMGVQRTIIDTVETKRLLWYVHLERINDSRWPKKVWQWIPAEWNKTTTPTKKLEAGCR